MPLQIVDELEMIDVDHEARERTALAPAARELLAKTVLKIATVAPTRQDVREPVANEPRAIDRVLEAERGNHREVSQEIRRVVVGEAVTTIAAHADAADHAALAQQRQQRDGPQRDVRWKQQGVIGGSERAEPRCAGARELRRERLR